MTNKINITSIIIGSLAIQGLSSLFSFLFVICLFFIYGSKAFVAFTDYPEPVAVMMFLTLLTGFVGGYLTMTMSKASLLNPLIVGAIYLGLNILALYLLKFGYARDYQWMLIITGSLIIPATVFGGHVYSRKNLPRKTIITAESRV